MRKKEVTRVYFYWYALFIFVMVVFLVLLKNSPTITGRVVYQETLSQKDWIFDTEDYSYNSSVLNFSVRQVNLIPQINITHWTEEVIIEAQITSAVLREHDDIYDKTVKVQFKDEEFVTVNKENARLDFRFSTSLSNGDIISFFLRSNNDDTVVYLCDENTTCDTPDYGQVEVGNEEGWYNLTITGLVSPHSAFTLNPSHKLKVDYITAVHTDFLYYNSTTLRYPASAFLETNDFYLPDLGSWQMFSKTEELNSQNISYSYSQDSGIAWLTLPEGGDISSLAGNKIRIKALLTSDGTGSSVLQGLRVYYVTRQCIENWTCMEWNPELCPLNQTQMRSCIDTNMCGTEQSKPITIQQCIYVPPQVCIENWTINYGVCQTDDTILKSYVDNNYCGTANNLPLDNNTRVSCDYCTPFWQEINGSCWPGNTFTSRFNDTHNCYVLTGLELDSNQPADTIYSCNYCALYNCTGSFGGIYSLLSNETWQVNAINETNSSLELSSNYTLDNVTVTLVEYSVNPQNSTVDAVSLYRYVDVNSSLRNFSSVKIIQYYTEEEVNQNNVEENTLTVYYYNEVSQQWEELNSTINVTGKYIYTVVSQWGLYGLFGQGKASSPIVSSPASNSGGGGGGGEGGASNSAVLSSAGNKKSLEISKTMDIPLKTKTISSLEAEPKPSFGQRCNYVLEVFLPEEISLIKNDFSQGEIVNRGNCIIQKLDLYLSPELAPLVDLPQASFTNLQEGNTTNFILIRKSMKEKKMFDFFTGSVVADIVTPMGLVTPTKTSGYLTLEGLDDQQSLFKKNITFTVEVLNAGKTANYFRAVFFTLLGVLGIYFFFRVGKGFFVKKKKFKWR
ncbi:hypothetical protein HYX11_01865 [Candidatus Woesearchaeota archaeon]|nr:hypothetical protein [Candidatus Woesearchaeota archaeon]